MGELAEKPLRKEKEHIEKLTDKCAKEQTDLEAYVLQKIEELKTVCLEQIKANKAKTDQWIGQATGKVDCVVSLQNETRGLLSISKPHLIQKFNNVQEKFTNFISDTRKSRLARKKMYSTDESRIEEAFSQFKYSLPDLLQSKCKEKENSSVARFILRFRSNRVHYLDFRLEDFKLKLRRFEFDEPNYSANWKSNEI